MENNNWIFSDEYRKMIKNMNQITKNLSPKFDALCRNNLQLRSILKTNINQEMLSAIAGFKKQMVPDFQNNFQRYFLLFNCLKKLGNLYVKQKKVRAYRRRSLRKNMEENLKYVRH